MAAGKGWVEKTLFGAALVSAVWLAGGLIVHWVT